MTDFFKNIIPTKIVDAVTDPLSEGVESITDAIAGLPAADEQIRFEHTLNTSTNKISYPIDLMGNNDEYKEFVAFEILGTSKTRIAEKFKNQKLSVPNSASALNYPSFAKNTASLLDKRTGKISSFTSDVVDSIVPDNLVDKADRLTDGAKKYETIIEQIPNSVIYMHMPNAGVSSSYEIQWGHESMGILANVDSTDDIGDALKNISIKGGKAIVDTITGSKIAEKRAKEAGYAADPKIEALFNGVGARKFQFDYDFAPRNETELLNALAIVKTFKYWALPGVRNEYSFTYPAKFKIKFLRVDGSENDSVFKINECYCTGVTIDQTPDSAWASFKNGAPVHFKMSIGFMEDKPLTREDIEAGS